MLPVHAVTAYPEPDQTQVQLDVPTPEPTPPTFVATAALVFQLAPPPVPPTLTGAHAVAQLAKTALSEPQLLAVLGANAWSPAQFTALLASPRPSAPSEVFAFRERVGFFGHDAPDYCSLPVPAVVLVKRPLPYDWDDRTAGTSGTTLSARSPPMLRRWTSQVCTGWPTCTWSGWSRSRSRELGGL